VIETGVPVPHFVPDELTIKAGKAIFFISNEGGVLPAAHSLAIGPVLHEAVVRSGSVLHRRAIVFIVENLPPGDYVFWCDGVGHATPEMVGTLNVTP
jgi:plastocyanin